MTAEPTLDRTTRAWLDLMPDEAPGRVIEAVLLAVETAPQVGRPRLAGPTRSKDITRLLLVAAVALLGILVVGGVYVAGIPNRPVPAPSQGIVATPPPPSTTPEPANTLVPTALQYRWMGSPREIGSRGQSMRTGLNFTATTTCITGTTYGESCRLLNSDALVTSNGELLLFTKDAGGLTECDSGDHGTYAYKLSPGGTMLTIVGGMDTCSARLAGVNGTWYRVACKNPDNGCWGDLEAGRYPTQDFAPLVDPGAPWSQDFGAVTFTVPAGWSLAADRPYNATLMPSDQYAVTSPDGASDGVHEELDLLAQPFAAVQDDTCAAPPDTTVDRSVAGLSAWITSRPGLVVTGRTDVRVDDNPGIQMGVRLADDWTKTCSGDQPGLEYLVREGDQGRPWDIQIVRGERQRLTLVDLGAGDVLGLLIDSTDPARFDALAAQSQGIIDSLHIRQRDR